MRIYALFQRININRKEQTNQNWVEMVAKLDQYEKECIENISRQCFATFFQRRLDRIEYDLTTNDSSRALYDIDDSIETLKAELNQLLFLNKSIIFVNKEKNENPLFYGLRNYSSRLLLVNDQFISNNGAKRLFKK